MTAIARIDHQSIVGAAAAPDVAPPDAPAPAPEGPKLPALALLAGGGAATIAAMLARGSNPLLRVGGGLFGIGLAITGAMMLGMGGASSRPGSAGDDERPSGTTSSTSAGSTSAHPLGFNQERREGPTPNGGAWSIASYFDAAGEPVEKAEAVRVTIVEYAADGSQIAETSGTIGSR